MPFRFGLIGAGVVAETHVAAMRLVPDVAVVAVADPDLERARDFARRHEVPGVHATVDELLRQSPVDAVAILTPHHLHLPAARAAARAGRHVLVEKAIAHTVAAADEMIAVCVVGADPALHARLDRLVRETRVVFFAGLPGTGKTLCLQAVLRHRHAEAPPLDTVLPTASLSVYDFGMRRRDLLPTPAEVAEFVTEVEGRYPEPGALEREVARWYDV